MHYRQHEEQEASTSPMAGLARRDVARVADEIKVSQGYLSECVIGTKRPSLDFVDKIREATDGEITAEHF